MDPGIDAERGKEQKGHWGNGIPCRGDVGRKEKSSGKGEQRRDRHRPLNSSLEWKLGYQVDTFLLKVKLQVDRVITSKGL